MTLPDFAIHEQRRDGEVRLTLVGELDLYRAPGLEDRLQSLTFTSRVVRLDLSKLDFIDSSGLRVLIRAFQDARDDGRQLRIEPAVSPNVKLAMNLARFDRYLLGDETSSR
jgi:anti-sigma B factor antagonist